MEWHEAVAQIRPHIVRISTPEGSGTGFLVARSAQPGSAILAIATAAHVVLRADEWQQPIRVQHHESGETVLLHHGDRVILTEADDDTAAILMDGSKIPLPKDSLPLILEKTVMKVGVEMGWVGFPAVSPRSLCFFTGVVSARMRDDQTYLVDGVAINGVSGGPVFVNDTDPIEVVGVVSAYIANRATGETLPGLAVVQDVRHFQEIVKRLKNLDEAAEKKADDEAALAQDSATEAPPSEGKATEGQGKLFTGQS